MSSHDADRLANDPAPPAPQSGTTDLQLPGQPMPAAGPLHRARDHLRMLQDLAKASPNKILKLARQDVSRLATLPRDKGVHQRLRATKWWARRPAPCVGQVNAIPSSTVEQAPR